MPASTKISGSFKSVSAISAKVGASWKSVTKGSVKVSGAWKEFFSSTQSGAYELLETTILSADQATVSFSNLNSTYGSTYQHLQLRMVVRTTRALSNDQLIITFNSDAGTNYTYHELYATNSAIVSFAAGASQNEIRIRSIETVQNARGFNGVVMDILDPFETSKYTTARWLAGAAGINNIAHSSGLWMNTAALTTITIDAIGDLADDSRFSLYGLRGV